MPEVLEGIPEPERNVRSLPVQQKADLRRNGYKGNLDPLPPSSNGGVLQAYADSVYHQSGGRMGMIEYSGDPRAWGSAFMPRIKKILEKNTRGFSDTDAMWEDRKQQLLIGRAREADAASMGIKTTADTRATYTLADAKRILDGANRT